MRKLAPPVQREIAAQITRPHVGLGAERTNRPFTSLAAATFVEMPLAKYRTQLYQGVQRPRNTVAMPFREVRDDREVLTRFAASNPNVRTAPRPKVKDLPILVHQFE